MTHWTLAYNWLYAYNGEPRANFPMEYMCRTRQHAIDYIGWLETCRRQIFNIPSIWT
jgi:hypothetical protein